MSVESVSQLRMRPRTYAYAWYVTAALMVAYMFSFLDRQILNLMIGPIKRDLGISDSEFALITGAAFALLYTVLSLPLGWLSDRYSRKWIITGGVLTWSAMTALCGLAGSFLSLFFARVGVGIGEATLSPATYSMLADFFDKTRLPRAMSLYSVGVFMGVGVAMLAGGGVIALIETWGSVQVPLLGNIQGWHLVFVVVGAPGILVAALVAITVREPPRRGQGMLTQSSFSNLFQFVRVHPKLCASLILGGSIYGLMGGMDSWYPEMFIRTWGWAAPRAASVNGLSSLIAGPLGLILSGWFSSYLMARGCSDACPRICAYGAIGMGLSASLMPLMPTPTLMAALLFPYKFFVGFPLVLVTSSIQLVAPNRLRAKLGATFLLAMGVIAVTCGPIAPALLTDFFFHDESKLRYSLAIAASVTAPIAFLLLWVGLADFRSRLKEMEYER